MPPIVIKKGIAGHIYAVPIAQSQVLPFRSNDFMQHHTLNLDGVARIFIRKMTKRREMIIVDDMPDGFVSKIVRDAYTEVLDKMVSIMRFIP